MLSALYVKFKVCNSAAWTNNGFPMLRPLADAPRVAVAAAAVAAAPAAVPAPAAPEAPAAEAAEAPAEEEEADGPIDEELLRSTREMRGWRVSYCKLDGDEQKTLDQDACKGLSDHGEDGLGPDSSASIRRCVGRATREVEDKDRAEGEDLHSAHEGEDGVSLERT